MSTGGGANDKSSEAHSNPANGKSNGIDQPLYMTYPVNSVVELTLAPDKEVVQGLVYTTDEITKSIVLKKSLKHTTLASEIRICNAASVLEKTFLRTQNQVVNKKKNENGPDKDTEGKDFDKEGGFNPELEMSIPLPAVSKKSLDEKEKRSMYLAEEAFSQINQKATPEGQAVFDRLLKACNEVMWKDESIFVLNQIRVDPPYTKDNCKLLVAGNTGSLNEGSLDRVKKIVSATSDVSGRK